MTLTPRALLPALALALVACDRDAPPPAPSAEEAASLDAAGNELDALANRPADDADGGHAAAAPPQ